LLRRTTTSGRYIPEIDGLRFIAILTVVLFHVAVQSSVRPHAGPLTLPCLKIVLHGTRGVWLFFAISGFILGLPFAQHHLHGAKRVPLSLYFLRRITRLEPPYILALLLRVPLLVFVIHTPLRRVLWHLLASIFYIHTFAFGVASTINPPAWSLEVEIEFYCLVPLLAYYFAVRKPALRRFALLLAMVVCGLIQLHYPLLNDRLQLSIANFLQYFLAGFLLCDLYVTEWGRIRHSILWDLACLPIWFWIFFSSSHYLHMAMPFLIVILYIGAFKGALGRWFFASRPISIIGGMCYSIYLTHNLVLSGLVAARDHLAPHFAAVNAVGQNYFALAALSLPAVALIGAVYYVLIEHPCMDKTWPQRLLRWLKGNPAPASS
jgi:peptidoglycan/LPS O-acetylase OafA/YrhL